MNQDLIRNLTHSALLIAAALVLGMSTAAGAEDRYSYPSGTRDLEGVIIKVASAGELVLWEKGRRHPFTLYGISLPAPESPGGKAAKKKVSDLIFNTLLQVHLLPDEGDDAAGVVIIRGNCLNNTLVRLGLAKVDPSCRISELCKAWKETEKISGDNARGN